MLRSLALLALAVAPLTAQTRPTPPTPPASTAAPVEPRAPYMPRTISIPSMNIDLDMQAVLADANLALADAQIAMADQRLWSINSGDGLFRLADGDWSHLSSSFNWNWNNEERIQPPAPWAKEDPADSLYRIAREALNRGDYRRAATQFDDLVKRYPKSAYAKDAPYWQAFALYRLGGTPDLTQALALLEKYKTDNPAPAATDDAKSRDRNRVMSTSSSFNTTLAWVDAPYFGGSGRPDIDGLAARIAGVLASRGQSDNAAVKRALAARGDACDSEDQAIRIAALGALMESAPDQGKAQAAKILSRRDECSVPLRRNALLVLSTRNASENSAAIIGVARNDPSTSVRTEAINTLGHMTGDDAVTVLDELTRSTDAQIQRTAVQALGSSPNPKARGMLRAMVERTDTPENLRLSVIDAFLREKTSTAEDATWLRGYYSRTTSTRTQERIAEVLGRVGGEANNQWLLDIAKRESEPAGVRAMALSRLGKTMDIPSLGRFYDTAPSRQMRESVIGILGGRSEPEAVDKLIEIAKNSTDPNNRRSAISVLARSKDPRAQKLLLDLVDR